MALHSVVRTDAGNCGTLCGESGVAPRLSSESIAVSIVMDVVTKEARSGLPWELLHADDLVLMATIRDELRRKLVEWRASFVVKRLKVNAGNRKLMVGWWIGGGLVSELVAWSMWSIQQSVLFMFMLTTYVDVYICYLLILAVSVITTYVSFCKANPAASGTPP